MRSKKANRLRARLHKACKEVEKIAGFQRALTHFGLKQERNSLYAPFAGFLSKDKNGNVKGYFIRKPFNQASLKALERADVRNSNERQRYFIERGVINPNA